MDSRLRGEDEKRRVLSDRGHKEKNGSLNSYKKRNYSEHEKQPPAARCATLKAGYEVAPLAAGMLLTFSLSPL